MSDAEVAQCFEEGKHFFDLNDEQKAQYGWVPDRRVSDAVCACTGTLSRHARAATGSAWLLGHPCIA